jgi:hypothetical protein
VRERTQEGPGVTWAFKKCANEPKPGQFESRDQKCANEPIYERAFVKRGGADSTIGISRTSPFAVGFGRSGLSLPHRGRSCGASHSHPLSPRPRESFCELHTSVQTLENTLQESSRVRHDTPESSSWGGAAAFPARARDPRLVLNRQIGAERRGLRKTSILVRLLQRSNSDEFTVMFTTMRTNEYDAVSGLQADLRVPPHHGIDLTRYRRIEQTNPKFVRWLEIIKPFRLLELDHQLRA